MSQYLAEYQFNLSCLILSNTHKADKIKFAVYFLKVQRLPNNTGQLDYDETIYLYKVEIYLMGKIFEMLFPQKIS